MKLRAGKNGLLDSPVIPEEEEILMFVLTREDWACRYNGCRDIVSPFRRQSVLP